MNILKSNLVLRVEELVEDLRQFLIVLKSNIDNVGQSQEVSQPEKLREQVTPVITSRTEQKQRNYYVPQVQKTKQERPLRKLLEQGTLQRDKRDLREAVKLTYLSLNTNMEKSISKKGEKVEKEKQQGMCLPMMQNYSCLLDLRPLRKQKQQNLKEGCKAVFLRLLPHKVNTGSMKDESLQVELQQQQADREYLDTFRSFKSNQKKKVNNLSRPISAETADQGWKDRSKNHSRKIGIGRIFRK